MYVQTEQITHRTASAAPARKPRGARLVSLRAYLDSGKHLVDPNQELSAANLKSQRKIAREVGYRSNKDVFHTIRREYPLIAATMHERSRKARRAAPKKDRLFRYIEQGQHLRDPESELSAANLKTQREIAEDLHMHRKRVSDYIREHFPIISAVMSNRKRYDQ